MNIWSCECQAMLRRYLLKHVRDPSEVHDLVQDAYERYLRLPKERAIENPVAYLFVITANLLRERAKQAAKMPRVDLRTIEGVLPDEGPDPYRIVAAREELTRTLAGIHPAWRDALLLSREHDLGYREIAKTLGVKPTTALNHIGHAVMRARAIRKGGGSC